jgi:hypothetical protein
MRNAIKLGIAIIVLLVALTSCNLYQAINLDWGDAVISGNGSHTQVSYQVYNLGKYDLTGINLLIGLDTTGDGLWDYSAWTADFSLSQNSSTTQGVDFIGISYFASYNAYVLSVDMDKP